MKYLFSFLILVAGLGNAGLATEPEWPAYGGPDARNVALPFDGPMVGPWVDAPVAWQSADPIPDGMAGDARDGADKPVRISGGYGSPAPGASRGKDPN